MTEIWRRYLRDITLRRVSRTEKKRRCIQMLGEEVVLVAEHHVEFARFGKLN